VTPPSTSPSYKAEHDAEEWLAAMEALLLVAESDGPTPRRDARGARAARDAAAAFERV
jgi:hypothetical protein